MRFKKLISFVLVAVTAVTLSSCGSEVEDRTTQLLNIDNASQGQLVWDDSDPDSATWRLQCTSPTDFKWLMGLSLQQIKSDAGLRSYCDDAAKTISRPTPFTVQSADLEIDAFLAALPKYKICSSIFRYQMGLIAEEEAQTAYDAAVTSKELGDFVGGSLDLNEAMEFQSDAAIYKSNHEESAVKISKTPAADLCGDIQF
jgi:hypothetical protein